MYKVSVIVPVYNLEHVLANTLESLALQTFRDFEIIVVDDNSMDGSAGLAEDVLNTFGVVHSVIRHQDNLGVSAARNTGLSVARGTYVIFFDGDDLAESNFVSCLYESISNNDVDAVFCGYKTRESKSGKETFYPSCEAMPASTQDAILRLRLLNKITAMMWAAIYKREYLIRNNICFTEKRIAGEDVEFVTKVIAAGAKLSFIKECLYIYMQHENMGTRKSMSSRDKMITRYKHHTEAHFDEATFIIQHMNSKLSYRMAEHYLVPIGYQRMFSVYAAQGERKAFDCLLYNSKVRNILLQSFWSFFDKPEVFMKSLFIVLFPNLYYRKYYVRFNKRVQR